MGVKTRDAGISDVPRIHAIYLCYTVDDDLATFEEVPPTLVEMERRYNAIKALNFPFIVCEDIDTGEICGYAYAGKHRERSAYRFAVEETVYIDPKHQRKGAGTALLSEILVKLTAIGITQVLAVLGTEEDNPGSFFLHMKHGFEVVGILKHIGFKNGRWVDRVWMQRSLQPDLLIAGVVEKSDGEEM